MKIVYPEGNLSELTFVLHTFNAVKCWLQHKHGWIYIGTSPRTHLELWDCKDCALEYWRNK